MEFMKWVVKNRKKRRLKKFQRTLQFENEKCFEMESPREEPPTELLLNSGKVELGDEATKKLCTSLGKSRSIIRKWNKKFEELLDLQREAQTNYCNDEEEVRTIVCDMSLKMREQFDALNRKEAVLRKEQRKLTNLQNELVSIIRQMALTDKKLASVKNEQKIQKADLVMLIEKDVKKFEADVSRREAGLFGELNRISKLSKPEKAYNSFLRNIQIKQRTLKKLELLAYKRLTVCQEGKSCSTGNESIPSTPTGSVLLTPSNASKMFEFSFSSNTQLSASGLSPDQHYKKLVDGLVERSKNGLQDCDQQQDRDYQPSPENNNNNACVRKAAQETMV